MLEQELEFAVEVVRSAVRICRSVQGQIQPGRWAKGDRTPVTVADLAVQAVVGRALHERFPDDPLMAEEDSAELSSPEHADLLRQVTEHVHCVRRDLPEGRTIAEWVERGQHAIDPSRRYWVLDPVDGTKGFLRKEQYAIALALIERGQILLGVLACPNLPACLGNGNTEAPVYGQLYAAVKGQGALRMDLGADDCIVGRQRLRVSAQHDSSAVDWVERVESSDKNHDVTAQVVERVGIRHAPHRLDSQAKYAVVARGEAALYLRHSLSKDYREKVWDHAAGVLITHEAGGKVTDVHGKPLDFSAGRALTENRGIVATNGLLHDRVLSAARDVLAVLEPHA
jgi:3'(2'), 5'-bisphosphate nucleotidase